MTTIDVMCVAAVALESDRVHLCFRVEANDSQVIKYLY